MWGDAIVENLHRQKRRERDLNGAIATVRTGLDGKTILFCELRRRRLNVFRLDIEHLVVCMDVQCVEEHAP